MHHAGDAARDVSFFDHEMALFRQALRVQDFDADELLPRAALCQDLQAALSDEERLVQVHRPAGICLERIGQAGGVLAHDEMTLLQAQHPLRFDAERPQALRQPCPVQRLPHRGRAARGDMDFIAQLAHEPDPHPSRLDASDPGDSHAQERKRTLAQISIGQALKNVAAQRSGSGLETGNWTDSGHPTGRRVTFTNSFAIEGHYFNFSTSGQWLWDELQVVLPAGENPYPIVEAITKQVGEVTADSARQAEQERQRAVPSQGAKTFSGAPGIDVKPVVGGVEIAVRYITRANERFQLRARLYQSAVDLLAQKPAALPAR